MCDDRACIDGVNICDSPQKSQKGTRVFRHAVIRPRRVLKLFDLATVGVPHLHNDDEIMSKLYWERILGALSSMYVGRMGQNRA